MYDVSEEKGFRACNKMIHVGGLMIVPCQQSDLGKCIGEPQKS